MAKMIKIKDKVVGDGYPCFTIAEIGVNHNGDIDIAKRLIDEAAKSGVDAVKFQTFKVENLILSGIEKAPYQKSSTDKNESQTNMLKTLEIDRDFHRELIDYCSGKNIIFLSTPYDEESLDLLIELGVSAVKIASTDTTNLLFLEKVARIGKPVIISTGMSSLSEVKLAYQCMNDNGCVDLAILKCTSDYPTDYREVNLNGMITLKEKFDAVIGFSDHTEGLGASPYAVAMGASIIEKHFTLDKNMTGPDHRASLSPDELVSWVEEIRKVELMMGVSDIAPTEGEKETKRSLQKCLVSKIDLKKGDVLTCDNITAKRTGGEGIPAFEVFNILGARLMCDIPVNNPVYKTQIEK